MKEANLDKKERLKLNKSGWDNIADDWFGSTALPVYGPHMKTEDDLKLFGSIQGKKVLDIGCGSGHSLKYMADQGASELWGLDISSSQIRNAKKYLAANNYDATLFESPMEENPGIKENYFDIVYSIYAFGWTVDLDKSLELVSKYLKPGGIFVMSWDHPLQACTHVEDGQIKLVKSYHDLEVVQMNKANNDMCFTKWKMSSYINGMSKVNLYVEDLVEDVKDDVKTSQDMDYDRYYSKFKAKHLPCSMIIKARKKD